MVSPSGHMIEKWWRVEERTKVVMHRRRKLDTLSGKDYVSPIPESDKGLG